MGSIYDSFSNPTGAGSQPFLPQTGLYDASTTSQLQQMLAEAQARMSSGASYTPDQMQYAQSGNGITNGGLPSGPINSPYGNPTWSNPFGADSPGGGTFNDIYNSIRNSPIWGNPGWDGLTSSITGQGSPTTPEIPYEQQWRNNNQTIAPTPTDPFNGVRGGGASGPGVISDPRTTGMNPQMPQAPSQGVGGALQNTFATLNSPDFAAQVKAAQDKARAAGTQANGQPGTGAVNPLAPNAQQQNWLKDNPGLWGDFAKKFIGGQGQNGTIDPMNIDWTNFSNGKPEHITRALGVVNQQGGNSLAQMLGGQLVDNPMATFGTNQKDRFIKMPNGQMIDASALQNSLNGVKDFNGLTDILNMYKRENANYNGATSMDAQALIQRGDLSPTTPAGWNPSSFAGGNPTYAPKGAAIGNPSNPGMGTSNPVSFQGNQINAVNGQNGFPMFNYSQSNPGLNGGGLYGPPAPQGQGSPGSPTNPLANLPQGNYNVPPEPTSPTPTQNAPIGTNTNSGYYMNSGSNSGSNGYGGGGATTNNAAGSGSLRGGRMGGDMQQPKTTNSWTGSLPNGAGSVGK